MRTNALHTREILAWIVLACAIALFSVSYSFAQDKSQEKKSEIKIKIQKDENGKKIKIDTTITSDQLPALKEYLKEMDIDFDADANAWEFGDGKNRDTGRMRRLFNQPGLSREERASIEREMEKLRAEMKDLDHEMKDLHIEIYGFDDLDPENFDFHFKMPGIPHAIEPPSDPEDFFLNGEDDSDADCKPGKKFNFRFHSLSDEVPDSLNDDQHIIIYGAKGEELPVLEKEITAKDGNKIFIFRRKLPKEELPEASASMLVTGLKVYPNPGDGKISIRFAASSKGDVLITISDAKGSEVYSKTLNDFSGEYFNQVDISGKGKGTYYLKITQGEDSITKKLVVE